MNRTHERKTAFKIIFSFPFNEQPVSEMIKNYIDSNDGINVSEYIVNTVSGVYNNLETIDEKIKNCIKNRKFERLDNICVAAMRLGIYEIFYNDDIPVSVAVNEVVEIVKEYDDSLVSFVHGNLRKIAGAKDE